MDLAANEANGAGHHEGSDRSAEAGRQRPDLCVDGVLQRKVGFVIIDVADHSLGLIDEHPARPEVVGWADRGLR